MNHSGRVTNDQNGITVRTEGGNANDSNVVYAAKCTRHKQLYVGYTTTPLNIRFNVHRSHIIHEPDSCELVQHYAQNRCDFTTDLQVAVLAHVNGTRDKFLMEEDKWIARLNTKQPNGMNVKLSAFGQLYYDLFG